LLIDITGGVDMLWMKCVIGAAVWLATASSILALIQPSDENEYGQPMGEGEKIDS